MASHYSLEGTAPKAFASRRRSLQFIAARNLPDGERYAVCLEPLLKEVDLHHPNGFSKVRNQRQSIDRVWTSRAREPPLLHSVYFHDGDAGRFVHAADNGGIVAVVSGQGRDDR